MANGNIVALDLNLDQNYIKASVEEIVRAAIVQALGEPHSIVKNAVDATINRKVDRDGKPTTSSYGGVPYLEWLATKTVEDTVREAMHEVVQEQSFALKEEIKSQIATKQFGNELAAAFVDTVLKSAKDIWKMPVTVSFEKPKKDDY